MTRDTKGGILLILGIMSVPISLAAYAILSFVISQLIAAESVGVGTASTIGNLIRVVLGLTPIVGILFCLPYGAYLILTYKRKTK